MPLFKIQSTDGKTVVQVRAALAILFSLSIVAGFFYDKIKQETFMPIAIMAISWYFSKRDIEDRQKDKEGGGNNGGAPTV
jgi:hypothetical protein